MKIEVVDAHLRLLREVAGKLVEHGETGLAYRVDGMADAFEHAIATEAAAEAVRRVDPAGGDPPLVTRPHDWPHDR